MRVRPSLYQLRCDANCVARFSYRTFEYVSNVREFFQALIGERQVEKALPPRSIRRLLRRLTSINLVQQTPDPIGGVLVVPDFKQVIGRVCLLASGFAARFRGTEPSAS